MNALEKAVKLKKDLDELRPLDSEAEARIMQKFRLDWNYHSNNIEGNSLTYGETKALILFGITAQGKPFKDHFEITGHNEAINWILEIVKGETVLTEAFIRQLHTLLLKEASYKEAKTPDGKPTRRLIEVGKYKSQPNHVVTVTGETFYFATPEETPARMHELVEWFKKEKEKPDVNPIILAALFHYRFIRIHPFDDGNGRTARILMNFILMQFGYPPVIIKTEDKENYYSVLRLADADELEPFIEYIAENLNRSLEIMIRGAKGESIEEPDDFDKELILLERRLSSTEEKVDISYSREIFPQITESFLTPFFEEINSLNKSFSRFYISQETQLSIFSNHGTFNVSPLRDAKNHLEIIKSKFHHDISSIEANLLYSGFRHKEVEFSYSSKLTIRFELKKIKIINSQKKTVGEFLYSDDFDRQILKNIIRKEAVIHKEFIELKIDEIVNSSKN